MRRQKFENAGIDRSLGRVKIHGGPTGCAFGATFFAKFPLAPRGARFNFAKKVAPPSLAPRGARDGGATFFLRVLY